jgi:hypothetical protein
MNVDTKELAALTGMNGKRSLPKNITIIHNLCECQFCHKAIDHLPEKGVGQGGVNGSFRGGGFQHRPGTRVHKS